MKALTVDILRDHDGWENEGRLREIAETAIGAATSEAGLDWAEGAELSLLFTGDARMTEINGEWRGKPRPTNVLSFPGSEIEPGTRAGVIIGDLVFALETVAREAGEQNKPFDHHLLHLMIHGFLHLFGYDHEDEEEARRMEALETAALARLGIGDPYAYLEPDSNGKGASG